MGLLIIIILFVVLPILFISIIYRLSFCVTKKCCNTIKDIFLKNGFAYRKGIERNSAEIEFFKMVFKVTWNNKENNTLFNKTIDKITGLDGLKYHKYFITHVGQKFISGRKVEISSLVIDKSGKKSWDLPKYRDLKQFDSLSMIKLDIDISSDFYVVETQNLLDNNIYPIINNIVCCNNSYYICTDSNLSIDTINRIKKLIIGINEILSYESAERLSYVESSQTHHLLYLSCKNHVLTVLTDAEYLDGFRFPDLYSKDDKISYTNSNLNKNVSIVKRIMEE